MGINLWHSQGRRAEVELATSRGRDGPDEESRRVDMATAWLWARDRLAEQLRTTVLWVSTSDLGTYPCGIHIAINNKFHCDTSIVQFKVAASGRD